VAARYQPRLTNACPSRRIAANRRTPPSIPATITPDLARRFRNPVRGAANPDVMTNPVWSWIIEHELGAWSANELLGGPPSVTAGPCWCFSRYGQSETQLPDGRTVLIAGEHEDFYDPDFFIYNDVVVKDGERIEILGYPVEDFPPTDFHTATLIGERIILIGSLGYRKDRREGKTQVLSLDTSTWRFESVPTSGDAPGWLHSHSAELSEDGRSFLIRGGLIDLVSVDLPLIDNIDDWRLDIEGWRWTRLTNRRWPRFLFVRADRKPNHLFDLGLLEYSKVSRKSKFEAELAKLRDDIGAEPRLDLLPALYRPSVEHSPLPEEEENFRTHRIAVDGVIVRYVEHSFGIVLTVEGQLRSDVIARLCDDLQTKFELIENAKAARQPLDQG
jgi:hypothetical protein